LHLEVGWRDASQIEVGHVATSGWCSRKATGNPVRQMVDSDDGSRGTGF
jgi:hypothetical protein